MVEGGMDPRLAEEVVAAIYGVSRRLVGMEVRSAVGPGENYMSRIFRLRCIFRSTTTGGEEVETLVAKQLWQQQDEANRIKVTIAREAEFFRKENQIYTEVLPAMEEILRSTGDDEDVGWAKLMLSLPKERLLVFEDLADCGYSMVQRSRGLDLQHALIAAMQLARFHALSAILVEKGTLNAADFDSKVKRTEEVLNILRGTLVPVSKLITAKWEPYWHPIAEELLKIADDPLRMMDMARRPSSGSLNVINHGDPWTNNFMFKYDDVTGDVIHTKLLDYQMAFYGSYSLDLNYLLATSVRTDGEQDLQLLLRTYTDVLEDTFVRCGSDTRPPTLDQVLEEVERTTFYRLLMGVLTCPTVGADPGTSFDMEGPQEALDDPWQVPQSHLASPTITAYLRKHLKPYVGVKVSDLLERL